MTITVEIKPEVQAELAAQAAAHGLDVPAYAAAILEQAAQPTPLEPKNRSLEEFEKTLDRGHERRAPSRLEKNQREIVMDHAELLQSLIGARARPARDHQHHAKNIRALRPLLQRGIFSL